MNHGHNRRKCNLFHYLDLSAKNGIYGSRGISYYVNSKQMDSLTTCSEISSGLLKIHPSSIIGDRDLSELYISVTNTSSPFQFRLMPVNDYSTPYLVYKPEFKKFKFYANTDVTNFTMSISDATELVAFEEPFRMGTAVNGVITSDVNMSAGDYITLYSKTHLVIASSYPTFTITENVTGVVKFIVNKFNFSYSLVAKTESR
jgi:hypothetical protein